MVPLCISRCRQVHGGPEGPLSQDPPRLAGAGDIHALARVHEWIARFRVNIAVAAPDRFAKKERQRQGTDRNLCVGGAILSLDLKQAFDRVDRAALVQALRRLGTPDDLVAAVIAIHDTSAYHIEDDFRSSEIRTTRGIRQGCKLAPLLWVAISTTILHDLRDALSGPKRMTVCVNGCLTHRRM